MIVAEGAYQLRIRTVSKPYRFLGFFKVCKDECCIS